MDRRSIFKRAAAVAAGIVLSGKTDGTGAGSAATAKAAYASEAKRWIEPEPPAPIAEKRPRSYLTGIIYGPSSRWVPARVPKKPWKPRPRDSRGRFV